MKVDFLRQFYKDIDKIKDQSTKDKIAGIIETAENFTCHNGYPEYQEAKRI